MLWERFWTPRRCEKKSSASPGSHSRGPSQQMMSSEAPNVTAANRASQGSGPAVGASSPPTLRSRTRLDLAAKPWREARAAAHFFAHGAVSMNANIADGMQELQWVGRKLLVKQCSGGRQTRGTTGSTWLPVTREPPSLQAYCDAVVRLIRRGLSARFADSPSMNLT